MIQSFDLAAALQSLGPAEVFVGNPLTDNGMTSIGALQGAARLSAGQTINGLTAPERTGGLIHQATVRQENVTVVFPLIMGDPTMWDKISPWGVKGGGWARPQKVSETSLLLIPLAEIGGGLKWDVTLNAGAGGWSRAAGNGYSVATLAAAAPKNAVWLWRCFMTFGDVPYQDEDGGRAVVDVTATAMYDGTKPDGNRAYSIGDPRALATPIPVLL